MPICIIIMLYILYLVYIFVIHYNDLIYLSYTLELLFYCEVHIIYKYNSIIYNVN